MRVVQSLVRFVMGLCRGQDLGGCEDRPIPFTCELNTLLISSSQSVKPPSQTFEMPCRVPNGSGNAVPRLLTSPRYLSLFAVEAVVEARGFRAASKQLAASQPRRPRSRHSEPIRAFLQPHVRSATCRSHPRSRDLSPLATAFERPIDHPPFDCEKMHFADRLATGRMRAGCRRVRTVLPDKPHVTGPHNRHR